jgi:hypothetical protein
MKFTVSKFPYPNTDKTVWQLLDSHGFPLCKEQDEQTVYALAREILHQTKGNELYLWDYFKQTETLIDRN